MIGYQMHQMKRGFCQLLGDISMLNCKLNTDNKYSLKNPVN